MTLKTLISFYVNSVSCSRPRFQICITNCPRHYTKVALLLLIIPHICMSPEKTASSLTSEALERD